MPIKVKSGGGRDKYELTSDDWKQIDAACFIQCTGEEIAHIIGLSVDTLFRIIKREKGVTFAEYIKEKSMGGKASLRRKQWEQAKKGNTTMQIWLGKQWLNQSEKQEVGFDPDKPLQSVELKAKQYAKLREQVLKNDDV